MKKFCAAVVGTLTFLSSIAFAATVTTEPSLPAGARAATKPLVCDKYEGKKVAVTAYREDSSEGMKLIGVILLNDQKIAQFELSRTGDMHHQGAAYYVRNSPEGNWLKYGENEKDAAEARLTTELGLTSEQFRNCSH